MSGGVIGPLKIKSLAFGGSGVARHEGRVIFVRGAVPGDLVWACLVREQKRYAEAEVESFEQYSADRCEPLCPVFGDCGGCQWQMLPYAEQLRHKEQIFRDTMRRQCGIAEECISEVLESPVEWRYRSRVQFKCHCLTDGRFIVGFFRPGSHFVVDIQSCPVVAPEFNVLLPLLRKALEGSPYVRQITQFNMEIGDNDQLRLVVHYDGSDSDGLGSCLKPLQQVRPLSLYIQQGKKSNLQHFGGSRDVQIDVDVPSLALRYSVGGFAQINLAQNRRMIAEALRIVAPEKSWRVLDLYSGMGNFSLPFARRVASLIAVEDFVGSVEQGRANARNNQIENVDFVTRSARGAYAELAGDQGFDLVLLDPPRSGAKGVVAELVQQRAKRILYVSCDPMTLARDLNTLLQGGYRLVESQPVDMFPQTYHLESLTMLELVD